MAISHPTIPTIGGVPSRGEAYMKLMHHLAEAQSLCAVIAHLHQTEDNIRDTALASGWLAVAELLRRFALKITDLAQGKLIH